MFRLNPSQFLGVEGVIKPDATAAGTVTSGWIAAADFASYAAILLAGDLGASATVDAKIQVATDGSGTGAVDLSGAAITQFTKAGSDDNKQAVIAFQREKIGSGFTHFRFSVTVGTATSDLGGVVVGLFPTYGPATDLDLASVKQVISL